jgi:hypothetical protein
MGCTLSHFRFPFVQAKHALYFEAERMMDNLVAAGGCGFSMLRGRSGGR